MGEGAPCYALFMTGVSRYFVSQRFAPFGATIFAEMTALAAEHGAINLAQGFPDFDGPDLVKRAAATAIDAGHNQYARMAGDPELCKAIAARWRESTGFDADWAGEVTVTCGCTEALAAAMLGLVNPGDEVILFEPYYDSYMACAAMAGAAARVVTLRAPPETPPESDRAQPARFTFDPDELRAAFTPRTRLLLLNTPHNPTGKVFTREELALIASLCVEHDVIALTDEVYERLTYGATAEHVSLATLPGMRERTITCSSMGKTYSMTGWKIGWAVAPAPLSAGVRAAHQFLTFAAPTPLQRAAAAALREGESSVADLVRHYGAARDFLVGALRKAGLRPYVPDGTYFVMADHGALGMGDDVAFCRRLTAEFGVAAIPPSAFYTNKQHARTLARFAFCKRMETLEEAAKRLKRLGG